MRSIGCQAPDSRRERLASSRQVGKQRRQEGQPCAPFRNPRRTPPTPRSRRIDRRRSQKRARSGPCRLRRKALGTRTWTRDGTHNRKTRWEWQQLTDTPPRICPRSTSLHSRRKTAETRQSPRANIPSLRSILRVAQCRTSKRKQTLHSSTERRERHDMASDKIASHRLRPHSSLRAMRVLPGSGAKPKCA